jgi:hypothetical protein
VSAYGARRELAISAALDGKPPVNKATGKPGPEAETGGDLMAGLKAAVDAQSKGKSKPAAKSKSRKSKVSA